MVKKLENESIALYAERVRRLTGRAYYGYSLEQVDELALKSFINGLPVKQNFRLQMKTQQFKTLHDAVVHGSNLDQIFREERHAASNITPLTRFTEVDSDCDVENDCCFGGELDEAIMVRKSFDKVAKQFNKVEKRFNKFDHTRPRPSHPPQQKCDNCGHQNKTRTRQNSPCHACNAFGHWATDDICPMKNECQDKSPTKTGEPQNEGTLN